MRGKQRRRVFMLRPHGRMSPFQQAQMFSLQDAEHPQHRRRGRVRRLPGHRQGGVQRPGVQAPLPDRHRQLDQLGAAAGAGGVLLRRLLPGDADATTRQVELRRALGQLRQHLRRPRGAHDGPADRAGWCWPPTRTTCSTSSSAPASTACAAAPRRTRPPARRWTSPRPPTSSASCSTCWAATRSARAQLFDDEVEQRRRASRVTPAEFARIAGVRLRLRQQHATPTAWRRSATPAQRFGMMIDTHTADGLKVAREHRDAGRADDRAGNRAAGQVRRDHRRGAGPRAASARRRCGASKHCPSGSR